MIKHILLVDLCREKDSISKYEFVDPIEAILESSGYHSQTIHFSDLTGDEIENCYKIILCGTALRDDGYQEKLESFSWIKSCEKPVLGICAGMQVIGVVFGGRIVPQPAIGLEKMDIIKNSPLFGEAREIEGYHLHNYCVTLPDGFRLLAGLPRAAKAFQHETRPIYGIIFHPEVRNRWILDRFANL
jgi:GMP synthase-like glutamine amidotransferase